MTFFPQRMRSKSIATPEECERSLSQSCPNLLDLDANLDTRVESACSKNAHTPGPETIQSIASNQSSPSGSKSKKFHKSLFLLPMKFRRARERKAQTQALKLPVYPLVATSSSHNAPTSTGRFPCTLEPPLKVRPKHTRPTGLGLGLGLGLVGNGLTNPTGKLRRGSDSCILSPSSERETCSLVDIEHSGEDCDSNGRQSCPDSGGSIEHIKATTVHPFSAPPIHIIVSSSGDEGAGSSGCNLLKSDAYKKSLGKSLEQVHHCTLIMYVSESVCLYM